MHRRENDFVETPKHHKDPNESTKNSKHLVKNMPMARLFEFLVYLILIKFLEKASARAERTSSVIWSFRNEDFET